MKTNKHIIYSTSSTPIHTLQAIIDDAMIAKWREETRSPDMRGSLLTGDMKQRLAEIDHG